MRYTISAGDGFLEAKSSGDADLSTLDMLAHDIVAHPDWPVHRRVLIDHSAINGDPLPNAHLHALVHQNVAIRHQIGNARIAILVSRTLEFGMARMWEGLIASRWDATTGCFTVREQAIVWLLRETLGP
jgi:hypothetical protein